MTKSELGELIDNKKFTESVKCYGEDKYKNVVKEIFYDGMRAGYDLAKSRLDLLDRMPFGTPDEYAEKHMEEFKTIFSLCAQYENME